MTAPASAYPWVQTSHEAQSLKLEAHICEERSLGWALKDMASQKGEALDKGPESFIKIFVSNNLDKLGSWEFLSSWYNGLK